MALDSSRHSEPGGTGTTDRYYWPGLEKLSSVQDLLDQNKLLIAEINQNHEIKTPEALQRNAILIKQLNTNIGKVLGLYNELASLVEAPKEGTHGEPAA